MIAFDAMVSGEEWLCVELGGSEVYVVRLSAVYNARSPCQPQPTEAHLPRRLPGRQYGPAGGAMLSLNGSRQCTHLKSEVGPRGRETKRAGHAIPRYPMPPVAPPRS